MFSHYRYSLFNYPVTSNVPLLIPENHVPSHNLSFSFRKQNFKAQQIPKTWLHHWKSDENQILFSYTKQDDEYFIRFPDLAVFVTNLTTRSIKCYPEANISESVISHLFVDQIFPRIINHLFSLTLHCCAIRIRNSAILFLGQTGWGKSTLGASFHANGFEILNDDAITISILPNSCVVTPNYYGVRLKNDSIEKIFPSQSLGVHPNHKKVTISSNKQLLLFQSPYNEQRVELPVDGIFILNDPQECPTSTYIIQSAISKSIISLINYCFYLDIKNNSEMARCLSETTALCKRVPIFLLGYKRSYSKLPSVRKAILKNITQQGL